MAEYIEREAAIEAIYDAFQECRTKKMAENVLEGIPAADVRPVVLCRDCKFSPIGGNDGSDLEWPFNEFDGNPCPYKCLDNWYSHKPAPDFFCAAGKKREES